MARYGILVDLNRYLRFQKKLKFNSPVYVRIIYNEKTYRFVLRVGGGCAWAAEVTPDQKTWLTWAPFVMRTEKHE